MKKFDNEIVAKVIKAYLEHSLPHRKIQSEILNLPAPQRGGGFVAMEILHEYNIRKDKKGFLENKTLKEAKKEVKDSEFRKAISLLEKYEIEQYEKDFKDQIEINNTTILSDEELEKSGNRKPEKTSNSNSNRYKTNPRISKTVIVNNNYECQIDIHHKTFKDKKSKYFMEAHHLIPMSFQDNFKINIDRKENIISLCPNCHRAIHLGNKHERAKRIKILFELKKDELKNISLKIKLSQLLNFY